MQDRLINKELIGSRTICYFRSLENKKFTHTKLSVVRNYFVYTQRKIQRTLAVCSTWYHAIRYGRIHIGAPQAALRTKHPPR